MKSQLTSRLSFFDQLIWQNDRMLLDDLVFRLEHYKNANWDLGDRCFRFFKIKELVDQYAKFWQTPNEIHADNILELGIWDGGSIAFWFELLQPRKHVGVDVMERNDSVYFQHYMASRGLEHRIKTFWNTDQQNKVRLAEIVQSEFTAPLDLVIDDASHQYLPTKASFEAAFPFLRSGGLYIIEDWAWGHWKDFQSPSHPWATQTPLTRLVFDLVEATGSSTELIASLQVFQGFIVIQKGPNELSKSGDFKLDACISRRRQWSRWDLFLDRQLHRLDRFQRGG